MQCQTILKSAAILGAVSLLSCLVSGYATIAVVAMRALSILLGVLMISLAIFYIFRAIYSSENKRVQGLRFVIAIVLILSSIGDFLSNAGNFYDFSKISKFTLVFLISSGVMAAVSTQWQTIIESFLLEQTHTLSSDDILQQYVFLIVSLIYGLSIAAFQSLISFVSAEKVYQSLMIRTLYAAAVDTALGCALGYYLQRQTEQSGYEAQAALSEMAGTEQNL